MSSFNINIKIHHFIDWWVIKSPLLRICIKTEQLSFLFNLATLPNEETYLSQEPENSLWLLNYKRHFEKKTCLEKYLLLKFHPINVMICRIYYMYIMYHNNYKTFKSGSSVLI